MLQVNPKNTQWRYFKNVVEDDDAANLEKNQQSILTDIFTMECSMKTLGEAYFVAKQEMSLLKFESILSLE